MFRSYIVEFFLTNWSVPARQVWKDVRADAEQEPARGVRDDSALPRTVKQVRKSRRTILLHFGPLQVSPSHCIIYVHELAVRVHAFVHSSTTRSKMIEAWWRHPNFSRC
jgi:hypothetical protein